MEKSTTTYANQPSTTGGSKRRVSHITRVLTAASLIMAFGSARADSSPTQPQRHDALGAATLIPAAGPHVKTLLTTSDSEDVGAASGEPRPEEPGAASAGPVKEAGAIQEYAQRRFLNEVWSPSP